MKDVHGDACGGGEKGNRRAVLVELVNDIIYLYQIKFHVEQLRKMIWAVKGNGW